jgi:hypothetical protein
MYVCDSAAVYVCNSAVVDVSAVVYVCNSAVVYVCNSAVVNCVFPRSFLFLVLKFLRSTVFFKKNLFFSLYIYLILLFFYFLSDIKSCSSIKKSYLSSLISHTLSICFKLFCSSHGNSCNSGCSRLLLNNYRVILLVLFKRRKKINRTNFSIKWNHQSRVGVSSKQLKVTSFQQNLICSAWSALLVAADSLFCFLAVALLVQVKWEASILILILHSVFWWLLFACASLKCDSVIHSLHTLVLLFIQRGATRLFEPREGYAGFMYMFIHTSQLFLNYVIERSHLVICSKIQYIYSVVHWCVENLFIYLFIFIYYIFIIFSSSQNSEFVSRDTISMIALPCCLQMLTLTVFAMAPCCPQMQVLRWIRIGSHK